MSNRPRSRMGSLFGAGVALALAFAGTGVAAAPVAPAISAEKKSVPYYYLLIVESETRVACIRYAFDCSYTRSPKLSGDPFEVTEGFAVASGISNQPVGW